MDYPNINLDVYYILSEYSMHIFICLIVGFGSLIYCLSIRTPKSDFESPKLSKKKYKKEKPLRSKNITKSIPPKVEIKENTNVSVEQVSEIVEIGAELNEDDNNNSTWQPVVKPKRQSKNDKSAPKPVSKESPNNNDCDKSKSVPLASSKAPKAAPTVATASVPSRIVSATTATTCDKPKAAPTTTTTATAVKPTPIASTIAADPPRPQQVSLTAPADTAHTVSESPTHSLSDDFELVDVDKTSSSETDGLKVDIERQSATSATSGASRKKTKKQQKLISKQLIDAAAIEIDRKSGDKPVAISSVAKKKRPRKDI